MNSYKIIIAFLVLLLFWFGSAIIRLENFHYATQVGLCSDVDVLQRPWCLESKETRTSNFLHLLYGLKVL